MAWVCELAAAVAAVCDRRIKRVLWLEVDRSLLDTANLQDVGLSVYALDSRPHKATSQNTILPNASHDQKKPFCQCGAGTFIPRNVFESEFFKLFIHSESRERRRSQTAATAPPSGFVASVYGRRKPALTQRRYSGICRPDGAGELVGVRCYKDFAPDGAAGQSVSDQRNWSKNK